MLNKNIPRILVTVPCYQAVQPEPFLHFLIFTQQTTRAEMLGKYSVRWCAPGPKINTVTARNTASQIAIAGEADYILFIDDDMVIPHILLDRLLLNDVDIVSPLFFRTNPVEPLIFNIDELGNYMPIYEYPKNALFETPGGSGTGVMLIKVNVLKSMDIPIWHGSTDPTYGEDVDFCRRARALGFKSWCDSSIEVKQMSLPVPIGEQQYIIGSLTRGV